MEIILIITGLVVGALIGFLISKSQTTKKVQAEKDKYSDLDRSQVAYRSKTEAEMEALQREINQLHESLETLNVKLAAREQYVATQQIQLTQKDSALESMQEKLNTLKSEVEEIGKKYSAEFKNLANEILEDKSKRFTEKNREKLEAILKPLDENIREFKKTVADTYDRESKERFSLGEKVKELAELNQLMSEETRNLTRALKGESKTQGDWGEMILETILEKSGLRRDEEYFMQAELRDEDGKALLSDSENKKMRPDAIIKYPDNRTVIIDSKVSLNAFLRYLEASDDESRKQALNAHVSAIKNHIVALSSKGYDDYDKALDFVMMFIPSEPAYIAAMQGDDKLWSYAYEKRILLMNPTNLITSLKLIVDLWKREYQNRNAQAIAERGSLLYDKFVGFVESLNDIGDKLTKANNAYDKAYKQLSTGPGNLVRQAEELKTLGVKSKKNMPGSLLLDDEES